MNRRRRDTIAPPKDTGISRKPRDRIIVRTIDSIGMTVPDRFSHHRDALILIIHQICKSPEKDANASLARYLRALENNPEFAAAHSAEIQASRALLQGLLGRNRKESSEIIVENELLKIMFFHLD